jgi:TonB family protein
MLTLIFLAATQPAPYVGQLQTEQIRSTIGKNAPPIGACYQAELKKTPDLKGRVQTTFIIGADGAVVAVKVRASSLKNEVVEKCIVEALKKMQFPVPDPKGIVIQNYPFVFSPPNSPPLPADDTPVVDADATDIIGDLDPTAVDDGIKKAQPALGKCYAVEKKKNKKAKGVVRVTFVVSESGSVEHGFLERSSIQSKPLEACVIDAVKATKFAAPAWGKAMVSDSLSF